MKASSWILVIAMISLLSKSRPFQFRFCRNTGGGRLVTHHCDKIGASRTTIRKNSSESTQDDDNQKHQVHWKTSDGTIVFDAFDGETLRTAALRRGLVSPHNGRARLINCRGLGTCGTCAVEIETMDTVEPQQRNSVERARLAFPPHGGDNQSPNLRLACQVQVRGDVVVSKRTGFWGQYSELAKASEAETYLGDLEFVLDRKSPSDPSSTTSESSKQS